MSLLTVEYNQHRMYDALPQASPGFNPPVLVTVFARDLEALLLRVLNVQTILPLGQIGTVGAAPLPVNASNRGDIEVLLEIIGSQYIEVTTLTELGNLMRDTVFKLFGTKQYQGGTYRDLRVYSMVIVHRGVVVVKDNI